MKEFFILWVAFTLVVIVFNDYPGMNLVRIFGHLKGLPGYQLTPKQQKFLAKGGFIKSHCMAAADALYLVIAFYLLRSIV